MEPLTLLQRLQVVTLVRRGLLDQLRDLLVHVSDSLEGPFCLQLLVTDLQFAYLLCQLLVGQPQLAHVQLQVMHRGFELLPTAGFRLQCLKLLDLRLLVFNLLLKKLFVSPVLCDL